VGSVRYQKGKKGEYDDDEFFYLSDSFTKSSIKLGIPKSYTKLTFFMLSYPVYI